MTAPGLGRTASTTPHAAARRRVTGLVDDRQSVLWLTGFATLASVVYAILAPFVGSIPEESWIAMAALIAITTASFVSTYLGAVRAGVMLAIAGIWLPAVLLLVVAGHNAPATELFAVTVLFAALAAGRRVAAALTVVSVGLIAWSWWFLPLGLDPAAGPKMLERRPLLDFELLLLGAAISLWWSWRTERAALENAALTGDTEILETLREAVASSRSGIAISNTAGVVTYANQALVDMWKFRDARDVVGRRVIEFWADSAVALASLRALASGGLAVATLRARRGDGTEFDVELSGSQIVADDGRIDGYIGSFIDVTERMLAEKRFQVERERTRAIVESVLDIVVILDANGTIIFENPAVERVLGFCAGERVGDSILSHAHPDDVARAGVAMSELFVDPQKLARITMRFRHKDGSWRWLETFGRNLMDVPAIGGILGVGRDVSEQREMQARLDASERLETVGRLAGGIAHDFNNLLTAILGNAELACSIAPADGSMDRYLAGVVQAGERARDLTRKLLAFARREITQPIVIDLRDRLAETRELLHRILGEDIALTVEAGDAPLPVLIDPVHFEQVILNLAVNARDAMPSGGAFSITGEVVQVNQLARSFIGTLPPGPAVHLVLKDSGQGMPPEVLARVFEPFFTTKELGRGTGLGLSTAYGSIVQAGGAMRITSQVGAGTTFEILLPRAEGTVVAIPAGAPDPSPQQTACILVAEDDAGVRSFIVEVLVNAGCRVLEAVDGMDGTAAVDAHAMEIDLLVSDVVMPNRNGLDLAAHFRSVRADGRVLFVTGYSKDPTIEEQAARLEALVLLKPFSVEQLLSHVRRLLELPGA